MPHLFGWDTINPKVGGKDRTETDQSHLGGVGAAVQHLGTSGPVTSLLKDLRARTTGTGFSRSLLGSSAARFGICVSFVTRKIETAELRG